MVAWGRRGYGDGRIMNRRGFLKNIGVGAAALAQDIIATIPALAQGQLGNKDYENFYRLIGSYRSLSESVVDHAKLAGNFDWQQWKEERF